MANIPLQDIEFPGLPDKYTVPVVDNTLTTAGAAADAKKVGDEISSIKEDLSKISKSGAIYYDHALLVGEPLFNLSESAFIRGAGNGAPTYPFWNERPNRIAYVDFDLRVEYGKTYLITASVPSTYAETAQMGIQTYDQSMATAYENEDTSFSPAEHLNDTGWVGLSTVIKVTKTPANENGIGFKFTFRQSTSNPVISDDFTILGLTVYEIPNVKEESSDEEHLYEVSDSEISNKTRFIFGTDVAYPYTQSSNSFKTYKDFDLRVTNGSTYRITATVPSKYASTAGMIVIAYDQTYVDSYNNHVATLNVNQHNVNTGWKGLTQDIIIGNSPAGETCVGLIVSFRQTSTSAAISDDFIVNFTVDEISRANIEPDEEEFIDHIIIDGEEHKLDLNQLDKYLPSKWDISKFFSAVTISNPTEELMAHTSNVYDGEDGYLYVTYYANHTIHYEHISADIISKIAKVSQCDLHDSTVVETLRKGQDFGTFVQSTEYAPYDQILIPKSSGVFSYVFIATPQGENPTVATIDFDKASMELSGNATLSNFKYKIGSNAVQTVVMNTSNLDTFVNALLGTSGKTIGLYPILTRAVSYNGEYYTILGGFQGQQQDTGFGGCIIKTADYGKTWEYVAYDTSLKNVITSMWEGNLDISSDGKAFCLLRAITHGAPFGTDYRAVAIANSYDIVNKTWGEYKALTGTVNDNPVDSKGGVYYDENKGYYKIVNVDDSRPLVFIDGDYVYMLQNIMPRMNTVWKTSGVMRSTLQIWKFDKQMNLILFKRLRNDAGVHYFSIVNAGGRKYICFSEDKRHLYDDCKGDIAIMPIDFIN